MWKGKSLSSDEPRSGACSRIVWALVPPTPSAFTAARRGPLWDVQSLEYLSVPSPGHNVEALRQLPNLKRITYRLNSGNWEAAATPAEFWKAYDATGRRQQ